jgi:hypothetical protein
MDSKQSECSLEKTDPHAGSRERRIHERLDCWGTCLVSVLPDGTKTLSYPLNISEGGCYFESDTELPAEVGASVELHICVSGCTIRVAGKIRRMEGHTHAGIQFSEVSSRNTEQIQRLMAKLSECEQERVAGIKSMCNIQKCTDQTKVKPE